ncbi:MAG: tryptophan synthase subunit alpha [Bacteroidales bacterium]|nr:tryptophan synthase subunit alpha [Bacteroidales bacterium]
MEKNRIDSLFEGSKQNLLSVYFCAGATRVDDAPEILKSLQAHNIDMVEIGFPFSDPMADGVVIQEAATKALKNGMKLRLLFEQLKDIRKTVSMPLVFMGYLNPIMQFGFENFCKTCAEVGIDGCIIPDLPFADYINDFKPIADKYNIRVIMLVTPETSDERVKEIDANTSGFIYMVSSASTTGAQSSFDEQKQAYFRRIDSLNLKNERMVGFGVSNKATFEAACANSRGAIVGSKFVKLLAEKPTIDEAVVALKQALQE